MVNKIWPRYRSCYSYRNETKWLWKLLAVFEGHPIVIWF